jgi:hypothetical protein
MRLLTSFALPNSRAGTGALWDEPVHRVHRLPVVNPLTGKYFEFGLKMTFLMREWVLPDPKHLSRGAAFAFPRQRRPFSLNH